MKRIAAEEALRQAEEARAQAQADLRTVASEIAAFEKEFEILLDALLAGHKPSLLRMEIEAAIEEFRANGAEFTLTDLQTTLMARGRLSGDEIKSSRVRNRCAVLLKQGVLKRVGKKRGFYKAVSTRAVKPRRAATH